MRVFVHHADAVAVAVQPDAELRSRCENLGLERGEVFFLHRIGMVIGEVTVGFAEQGNDLGSGACEQIACDKPRRAVAAVENDLDRTSQAHQRRNLFQVRGDDVMGEVRYTYEP